MTPAESNDSLGAKSTSPKSVGEMMADIMGNIGNLVRNEVDLARAETARSISQMGGALGLMTLAVVLAITALNLLVGSVVWGAIWMGVPPIYAPLIIGLCLLIVAFAIYLIAKSALSQIGFMPARTARNVLRDAAAIKDAYHDK